MKTRRHIRTSTGNPLLCLAAILTVALGLTPLSRAQNVTFEDTTVSAGVDYLHWDGILPPGTVGAEREFFYMTGGAAAGDYDNDGWTDLYATRVSAPNLLFRNRGDGTFEELAGAAGIDLVDRCSGCAWGDVNNDGSLDLYVLTFHPAGRNYLFINDGNGQFTEEAAPRGVALAMSTTRRLFTSAAFGDVDLDGDLDLLVLEWNTPARNRLFINDGTGNFTDQTAAAGLTLDGSFGFAGSFADVDDDDRPDLLIAADFGTSRLFLNLGGTSFQDVTVLAGVGTDENGVGSTLGDVDNDGDLDWFVTSIFDPADTCATNPCTWGDSGNRLYSNDDGEFTDVTDTAGVRDGGWGCAASFLDFDNDGWLDLAMTNGVMFPSVDLEDAFNADPMVLWQNDTLGGMVDVSAATNFLDTRSGKGLVVCDYDRDGDQDVLIAHNAEHPLLLRNDGGNDNGWLQVELRGTVSNRFGLGARVFVRADPNAPELMREIRGGSNFMSQNEPVAHFGLGPAVTVVQTLTVRWPASGIVQTLSDVAANQRLLIEEPNCPGDVDGDLSVNVNDLTILLANFGRTDAFRRDGDLDGDGTINVNDLTILLANFSATCD